jgi:pimeloyl-ACP methyl ester carboxylesterase
VHNHICTHIAKGYAVNSTLLTTRNHIQTFTFCEGDGPPVVMLHGMVSTGDCWTYTCEALKSRHQVIAPDMPGHGRSGGGASPYSLAFYADWLSDFLDALGLSSATLIGQSMGGAICLAFALRHPERVSRLVLVDALGLSSKLAWRALRNMAAGIPDYLRAGLTHRSDPYLLRFFQPWAFLDPWGSPREIIERMAIINQPREAAVMWSGVRLLLVDFWSSRKRADFVAGLDRLRVPTLVVWGQQDGLLALDDAREGISRIPNASLEVIEDCAHEPMLERPEKFNRLVQAFLEPTHQPTL